MSDEYEFYQGAVLRQLIVGSELSLIVRPFLREGRINAFVVNGKFGVFIKHSTKRMSPWRFTFSIDQASDLLDLETTLAHSFTTFVCGDDGLITLSMASLHEIVSFQESEQAWVRIERRPRSQYSVSGNRAELPYKVPTGTSLIHEAIVESLRERRVS
jgi:hypothetical protein